MGEVSEMMLDGTLCQCCGVYMGLTPDTHVIEECETWESCGYPQTCEDCEE